MSTVRSISTLPATLALLAVGAVAGTTWGQLAVVGLDQGPPSQVFVIGDGSVRAISPYPGFVGGVRVALGDITGDGVPDIITGPGPGAAAVVRIRDGTSNTILVGEVLPHPPTFTGGVYVASGDVNGDGRDDIITGAGPGAGPHVKVFSGATGAEIRSFFAYSPNFQGGVRVAAGDVNGDGMADIITGLGAVGGPRVAVFCGRSGTELHSFLAFPGFQGGVFVASGDINNDGRDDIIAGADAGGPPVIHVFSPLNTAQPWVFPIEPGNPNRPIPSGARVGTVFRPPTPNQPNGIIAILIGLLRDNVPTVLELNPANGNVVPVASLQNFPDVHVFVAGNPRPARQRCAADFNRDGNVDPDDLSDYITCFFSIPPCERADFNQDGNVDPDDLADYITTFFTNCM